MERERKGAGNRAFKLVAVAFSLLIAGCAHYVPPIQTLTLPSAEECSFEPECKIIAVDSVLIVVEISRHVDMVAESWYEYCVSLSWCNGRKEWLLGYRDKTVPYPSPTFSCRFIGKAIQ